jgi:hypothetical protein
MLALSTVAACDSQEVQRGRALYAGEAPLTARIAGHAAALPPQASRCTNCHVGATSTQAASSAGVQAIGGILAAHRLTQPLSRRGGPPSRFDAAALCRLLRTGVDPAHVVIAQTMPRYEVSDADCNALWAYLATT